VGVPLRAEASTGFSAAGADQQNRAVDFLQDTGSHTSVKSPFDVAAAMLFNFA
jgi:hypothetical protein